MVAICKTIRRLLKDEEGQGLAEYSLILVLVSIAAIAIMIIIGENNKARMNVIANTMPPE